MRYNIYVGRRTNELRLYSVRFLPNFQVQRRIQLADWDCEYAVVRQGNQPLTIVTLVKILYTAIRERLNYIFGEAMKYYYCDKCQEDHAVLEDSDMVKRDFYCRHNGHPRNAVTPPTKHEPWHWCSFCASKITEEEYNKADQKSE